jgi:hypothetical protein
MGRKIEGYWDCSYCGNKGNRGRYRNCPSCGRPRDATTKFYLIEKDNYVPESQVPQGPDWFCECCDSYNTFSANFCTSCGAPKGASKDYFQIQKEKVQRQKEIENSESHQQKEAANPGAHQQSFWQSQSNTERPQANNDKGLSSYQTQTETVKNDSHTNHFGFFSSIKEHFPIILLVVLFLLVALGITYLIIPKTVSLNVTSLTWQRDVMVEEYKTVRESDWQVPFGGRIVYTNQEIKGYESVFDHYEQRSVTKSERYISGYRTRTEYVDLGNGYFDERTYSEPEYDTRYWTETEDYPVYRQEPIYATKYYYDIERWVYSRTATSSGEHGEGSPYWPELNLKINERESGKTEQYFVHGFIENDKKETPQTYAISYDLWKTISPNSTIKVVVQFGTIKEIKE